VSQVILAQGGLAGMVPGPNTSKPNPQHKLYPYLLRGLDIIRPNQVWSTDITYIRLPHGFVYLVAIIDWYSRKVLAWRMSNTMDAGFCVDCLEEAIMNFGVPEIFNTGQGSQFTSYSFTGVLIQNGITISMDGRGRALDNIFVERLWRTVKYEEVYLKQHRNMPDLLMGLMQYFQFYNQERCIKRRLTKRRMRSIKQLLAAGQRLSINLGKRVKHQATYNKIGIARFNWSVNRVLS
jgi:putative transposase